MSLLINTDFTYPMVFKKVQHINVFFETVFFGTKIKKNYPVYFFLVTKMESTKCNKSATNQKTKKKN